MGHRAGWPGLHLKDEVNINVDVHLDLERRGGEAFGRALDLRFTFQRSRNTILVPPGEIPLQLGRAT